MAFVESQDHGEGGVSVTIEDDVPVPPRRFGSGRPPSEAYKRAMMLRNGQCLKCDTEAEFEAARAAIRKSGGRYTSRKPKAPDEKWRIWRLA